uniref:Uncharacterized protein n=2 Tax=Anguilla anguilla TaxID=7936 RepID=A0A0E9SDQ3_ANGAN
MKILIIEINLMQLFLYFLYFYNHKCLVSPLLVHNS